MRAGRSDRTGLLVACAQWLAIPGKPQANLASAAHWIGKAAEAGADLVVLPEMWPSGYDVGSLASDVATAAEPVPGQRTDMLAQLARRRRIWVFAGSVPERDSGRIYNTALVFNRAGDLVARHRKAHLYGPSGEPAVFAPGDELTSFTDSELGRVGLLVCFDGDFPEAALALAAWGVGLVILPSAYEWEARTYWDSYYPAAALASGQWWVMANQCGTTSSGTLLGASRVISPAGRIVAEARRADHDLTPGPELLLCRLDETAEDLDAREFAALLWRSRRPELYSHQDRLRGEQDRLRGEQDRLRGEQDRLRGEQDRLRGEQDRLRGEQDRLPGDQARAAGVVDHLVRDAAHQHGREI
jgi:predicted amidohydrolase